MLILSHSLSSIVAVSRNYIIILTSAKGKELYIRNAHRYRILQELDEKVKVLTGENEVLAEKMKSKALELKETQSRPSEHCSPNPR